MYLLAAVTWGKKVWYAYINFELFFFQASVFYNIQNWDTILSPIFDIYTDFLKTAISRYHDNLSIAPIRLVCSCATHILKK